MKLLEILFGKKSKPMPVAAPAEEKPKKQLTMIAGKLYGDLNQLIAKKKDEEYLYEDIYGREWAHTTERYPCFDSYDYLHENRYYRWYVYRDGDDLWVIKFDDGTKETKHMKNPERIDYTCRQMLHALGWIEN